MTHPQYPIPQDEEGRKRYESAKRHAALAKEQGKSLDEIHEIFKKVMEGTGKCSDRFTVKIKGKAAHGSEPDKGADAVVAAAAVVMGLQTLVSRRTDPQNTFVLTVGMMNGGTQSNIIAKEVELVGTTRTGERGHYESADPCKPAALSAPSACRFHRFRPCRFAVQYRGG